MKLKHWQGYGTVSAKKISVEQTGQDICLTVEVTGLHECGLVCRHHHIIHKWLVARFVKNCPDSRCIRNVKVFEESDSKVIYEITYHPAENTK